jgi:hypothetical protein
VFHIFNPAGIALTAFYSNYQEIRNFLSSKNSAEMQEKHMKYFKFLLNLYDIDSFFEEIEEVS